jgi:hypothetical protein
MGFIWTIVIGFIAGDREVLMPGPNEPQGFIMTTILDHDNHPWNHWCVRGDVSGSGNWLELTKAPDS